MIKLFKKFIGFRDFMKIYQVLKLDVFVLNLGTMGVRFEKRNGYVEVAIVALGKEHDEVFLTKEAMIKKEKVIVEKIVKPKVEVLEDKGESTEEGLF